MKAFSRTNDTIKLYSEADAQACAEAKVLTLATEYLRLLMHFFHPIQQCAQQVYYTAVPLSPTSSQVHKFYHWSVTDNQLSCVDTFTGAPSTWGSLLRTIDVRPRWLTCITTSIQWIVAACEDIVDVYDAETFVLRQSLCSPEPVAKIQVSPDGSVLFFAHAFSVTVWDVQTGGLVHTFTTKLMINCMAVSTTHIACGLSNGSLTLWNVHTKKEDKVHKNGQPVVAIYWLTSQKLAVATWDSIYIYNITVGRIIDELAIPGHVWGMVYLEDKHELLIGTLQRSSDKEESFFMTITYSQCSQLFLNPGQSPTHSGKLFSPTLVGNEIACITPGGGVQSFNIVSYDWTNNPPPLDAAKSVAVSLNRNLVVQTRDSLQIFSIDVLTSSEARNDVCPSHIYPLGKEHIICILEPTRRLTLLELETLQELRLDDHTSPLSSLLIDQPASTLASFDRRIVAEFGVSAAMQTWQLGIEAADEDVPLRGWSPGYTQIVTFYKSPQPKLCVRDIKEGIILADLQLGQDNTLGMGKVYDLVFDSETRFHLKIDGPGQHFQIPHNIIALPSGRYSHTITVGDPVPLPELQIASPWTLDANCEWVIDAEFRKVCWISPGNVRRGNGGHFWTGLSLVMVGGDGIVRKLTFKEPNC